MKVEFNIGNVGMFDTEISTLADEFTKLFSQLCPSLKYIVVVNMEEFAYYETPLLGICVELYDDHGDQPRGKRITGYDISIGKSKRKPNSYYIAKDYGASDLTMDFLSQRIPLQFMFDVACGLGRHKEEIAYNWKSK